MSAFCSTLKKASNMLSKFPCSLLLGIDICRHHLIANDWLTTCKMYLSSENVLQENYTVYMLLYFCLLVYLFFLNTNQD